MATLKKEWLLKPESELRCETTSDAGASSSNSVFVARLVEGNAEIFGIEMAVNKDYSFRDASFAIFTWYGCKIETVGEAQSLYVSDKTPMISYVNTHVQLEAKRDVALANNSNGPRILVVGSPDQGKSTLSRILASYAVRLDRTPILIDLDCGEGSFSIPGTIAALPLEKSCLSIEDPMASCAPLVYFYGHPNPQENTPLFQQLISILAARVSERMARDLDTRSSGIIINTCGNFEGLGLDVITSIVRILAVDVVLVMGSDKVYSSLASTLPHDKTIVLSLMRSGGVMNRDAKARSKGRKNRIHTYFYGRENALSPERKVLRLSAFELFQVGRVQLAEGMKFIGDASGSRTALVRLPPNTDLLHKVLAVLHPPAETAEPNKETAADELPQGLLESNAAGFVYVIEISAEKDSITVLMPCPGDLPSKYLLSGGIKWYE